MADDLNLADLGHQSKIFAGLLTKQLLRIDFGNIERSQPVRLFAGRGLLEDQSFVLIDMLRNLADHACTA